MQRRRGFSHKHAFFIRSVERYKEERSVEKAAQMVCWGEDVLGKLRPGDKRVYDLMEKELKSVGWKILRRNQGETRA